MIETWQLRDPKAKSGYAGVDLDSPRKIVRARKTIYTDNFSTLDLVKDEVSRLGWTGAGYQKNGQGYHAVCPKYGSVVGHPREAAQDAIDKGWISQRMLDIAQRRRIGIKDTSIRYGLRQEADQGIWYLVRFPNYIKPGITKNMTKRIAKYAYEEGIVPELITMFSVPNPRWFEQAVLNCLKSVGILPARGREWFALENESSIVSLISIGF